MRTTQHKQELQIKDRQRGAIILIVTFSLVAFMLLLALVLDVGLSYIGKSQLQNAADAGALRGAKELDGTSGGLTNATNKALEAAGANEFLLAMNPLQSGNVAVYFASHPYPADWGAANTACQADPTNCFYIRVDTAASRTGWFSLDIGSYGLKALAVAGRTTCDLMPLFICANGPSPGYGFQVGRSYSFVPSPSGNVGPGNVGYLHPTATGPSCSGVSSIGTPEMQRLACKSTQQCFSLPADRCTVTQSARPNIADAINTRFDLYPPSLPNDITPDVCPPDRNIKEYTPTGAGSSASAALWMEGNPTHQAIPDWKPNLSYKVNDRIFSSSGNLTFRCSNNGTSGAVEPTWNPVIGGTTNDGTVVWTTEDYQTVWWSYVTPPPGTPQRTASPVRRPPGVDTAYPDLSPWVAPYDHISPTYTPGTYYTPPRPANRAAADSSLQQPRRLLKIAIATNCPVAGGTGSPVHVEGIGKFFMQIEADGNGPQDMIFGEFAGLTPALPTTYPDIRLFR